MLFSSKKKRRKNDFVFAAQGQENKRICNKSKKKKKKKDFGVVLAFVCVPSHMEKISSLLAARCTTILLWALIGKF